SRSTRHDGWAIEGTFFTTGDTSADEVTVALCHVLFATNGVGVEGIAAVDDDVAIFHCISELVDNRVGRRTGLHHDDGLAGALQRSDELFNRFRSNEIAFRSVFGNESTSAFRTAVVHGDGIAIASKVTGQVAAHNR